MPNAALYPVRAVAFALLVYGACTAAHGSGFLAVLLAGILVGDTRAPYKREIERFARREQPRGRSSRSPCSACRSPCPTPSVTATPGPAWGLAALLILVIRPVFLRLVLLAPIRLRLGERAFVLWSGLKGAVPILLGTYPSPVARTTPGRIYAVIYVVVLVSVAVQGGLVPTLDHAWRVPMRVVEPEPWALGMRFRDEPEGLHRYVVRRGSAADGTAVGDLPLGEDMWISMISRAGRLVQVRAGHGAAGR